MKKGLWRNARRGVLIILLIGIFFQVKQPPAAQAASQLSPLQPNIPSFNQGDLLVGTFSGSINRIDPTTGVVLQTINTSSSTEQMCFDSSGNLYVIQGSGISKFDTSGNLINAAFVSGLTNPASCVFDIAGDLYVGTGGVNTSNGFIPGQILKFDANGNLLATFNPNVDPLGGAGGFVLAPNQCTIYYLSGILSIRRFNVCTNSQLPDLVSRMPNSFDCGNLKVLPGGQILIPCWTTTAQIYLVNPDGSIAHTYQASTYGAQLLEMVALDPGGSAFWTATPQVGLPDTIYHIELATGNLLGTVSTTFNIERLEVVGGAGSFPSPPVHPIIFVHGINQNLDEMGVAQLDPSLNKFVPLYQELRSVYGQSNITSFRYLDDRALAAGPSGCPPEVFPPCKSQSSVTDNGRALSVVINQLYTQTQHKVTLIGYSMGGAIIRTALAGCPDTQDHFNCAGLSDLVDSVFFINPVQQGSYLLRLKQGFDVASAFPGIGKYATLLANIIYLAVQSNMDLNPNYPAEVDLTPGSANIQAHNGVPVTAGIQFFNFYGNINLQLVARIGPFTVPLPKVSVGDYVLFRGDDDPQATPFWGGARFCLNCGNQSQFVSVGNFSEWPLSDVVQINIGQNLRQDLGSLVNTTPESHIVIYSDNSLGGGIQVQDSTGQGGTTGIAHEILLQLEKEDGIL